MTRYRRRAYSLIYILAALPLITAIASSAYLLSDRVLKVQGREQRRVNSDTIARDIVRRIQADARQARSAQIANPASPASAPQRAAQRAAGFSPGGPQIAAASRPGGPQIAAGSRPRGLSPAATAQTQPTDTPIPDNGCQELTLDQSGQQIIYRGTEGRITRTCSTAGAAPIVFEWKLPKNQVVFRIEAIKGSPGIAWITFIQEIQTETGPSLTRQLSAAAPIGQGGTP